MGIIFCNEWFFIHVNEKQPGKYYRKLNITLKYTIN